MSNKTNKLNEIFSVSRAVCTDEGWQRCLSAMPPSLSTPDFPERLARCIDDFSVPPYMADLARLELAVHQCQGFQGDRLTTDDGGLSLNPSLALLDLDWTGLSAVVEDPSYAISDPPQPCSEMVMVWKHAESGSVRYRKAQHNDLLSIKIILEEIDPEKAAAEGGVSIGFIDNIINQSVQHGIILRAPSKLRRDAKLSDQIDLDVDRYLSPSVFTLQWHITQACDLHCKHCYDRSKRSPLKLEQGFKVLDDLRAFCVRNNIKGQVSFTGGNPLLYPHFTELYRAASDRGFMLAILGNPTTPEKVDELLAIQKPEFFQVSLEGLADHNDDIRGSGHFARVMDFLDILRSKRVYSMVMLTLTQANFQQVLPLGEMLREKADLFIFNRLTLFGEGANIKPVPVEAYSEFLVAYQKATQRNPVLGFKDNLFNRVKRDSGLPIFGGCAGYGCGAAFNFLALLPDGEVHACRKFPSLIGNIFEASLDDIYDSKEAERYRRGTEACRGCSLEIVCRGCPAVVAGHGLNPHVDRDPYCSGCV